MTGWSRGSDGWFLVPSMVGPTPSSSSRHQKGKGAGRYVGLSNGNASNRLVEAGELTGAEQEAYEVLWAATRKNKMA